MTEAHAHGADELCEAGLSLYTRALREGQVDAEEASIAPCLIDLGLLQPDIGDLRRLRPVTPVFALHRLLRHTEDRIADARRREERLAETFEALMGIDGRFGGVTEPPQVSVLSGLDRINLASETVMADASGELLTIQPFTGQDVGARLAASLQRDQTLLDRGGRIRTLYQHTVRHSPAVIARYEQLRGNAEARTMDEVTDRLIVINGKVAFIPASRDRTLAVEIRHPALVAFDVTVFDRLWRLATPMHPEAALPPVLNGITHRQRTIARLLIEGHTDAVIADRLGMNVRTARVHIAELATALGSGSRAQLGYLIAASGILDQGGVTE